ncbi:hypothetical protein [Neobacillus ginsengisoli]|uniref:Lipoprotein n=1 Tax=Neobacillus ginsengisoli TaxID=904295 RepID=A0ABT9XZX7_9BACI|nr:hypothetical protein [Neobacillus ginsengisoli]MDQ0201113.1 hypothetical protein [Neobacillus ginsengisoli]
MRKKLFIAIMGTLLTLSLAGCGDALNNSRNDIQSQKTSYTKRSLTAPFSDLLYGFSAIEKYVANGDYGAATTLSNNLYDEFHDAILPPLRAKKGKAYAERIDKNYDELQVAISKKDKSKVTELIKENRDSLKTIAPILGVSVISSE